MPPRTWFYPWSWCRRSVSGRCSDVEPSPQPDRNIQRKEDVDISWAVATKHLISYCCWSASVEARVLQWECWSESVEVRVLKSECWSQSVAVRELKLECWSESVEVGVLKWECLKSECWSERVEVGVLKPECWSGSVAVRVLIEVRVVEMRVMKSVLLQSV